MHIAMTSMWAFHEIEVKELTALSLATHCLDAVAISTEYQPDSLYYHPVVIVQLAEQDLLYLLCSTL